jgi:spermidine synthase
MTLPPATISEADGVRYLHLGTEWVQGAMRIRAPNRVELEYVQRMLAWLLWRPERELSHGRAVQLGLGAGTLTRFCYRVLRMKTLAVELNPAVIGIARHWFHLPPDNERLHVIEGDAARWVSDPAQRSSVHVLNVDLYDHEAASPVLDDAQFYAACRDVLAEGAAMTVNLFGRAASLDASLERIAGAFGPESVWRLAPTREGNTIVVAACGLALPERPLLAQRADMIESRFQLPAHKWLRLVKPYLGPR